jgi:hypothetical protein
MSTGPRSDSSVQSAVAISGVPMKTAVRNLLDRIPDPPTVNQWSVLRAWCCVLGPSCGVHPIGPLAFSDHVER